MSNCMEIQPPPPPPQDDLVKECFTCKRLLPASAYCKGNITKYYKCKECERKRLAEYRRSVKERQCVIDDPVICLGCKMVTPKEKLAKTGKFAYVVCTPCNSKIKTHTRPHKAELINGKGPCTRCLMFGKSKNCIRPHKVDLDEDDDE